MDAGTRTRLLSLIAAASSTLASAAPPQYVASRNIVVAYDTANGAPISAAELWVSTDGGRTWQQAEATPCGQHALRYAAPADGKYDFYVVLRNATGPSAAPPGPGSPPVVTTIVDTTPPLLQIHAAEAQRPDSGEPSIALTASLVEENLCPTGLRVFYRTAGEKWLDGGPATFADRRIVWSPPAAIEARVDLRVVVTDLAGNRSSAEIRDLKAPRPADSPAQETGSAPPHVEPVKPPTVAPVALVGDEQPASAEPPVSPGAAAEAQRLRDLANRFLAEGRYTLAAARFEDAVRAAPQDTDLRVEWAAALYRAGQYDDARTRFREALDAEPDHAGALDGLALVAATQKQYPQAREYLRHLQQLRPNSGRVWLRSGDIEHRVGNTAEALRAWQRVLNLDDSDEDLRDKARRRLEYFGPQRLEGTRPLTANESWPELPPARPSSSSAETSRTRKPSP